MALYKFRIIIIIIKYSVHKDVSTEIYTRQCLQLSVVIVTQAFLVTIVSQFIFYAKNVNI